MYVKPNKIIPKTERSKWRFKVKTFYKQLNAFLPASENGIRATDLLKELFMILSYGTNFLTFSSWNTFGAIQVSQSDYLKNIMERNKEYKKNILLEKLEEFNLSKEWVEEYEKNR